MNVMWYLLTTCIWFAGVEPWSFYFLNGFLNFNIVFILALVAFPFAVSISCNFLWPLTTRWVAFSPLEVYNMTAKQSFKCSSSSIIILHYPSNAVTKLQHRYQWSHSLLVLRGNILETPWCELYICAITTQYEKQLTNGIKITTVQPIAKSSLLATAGKDGLNEVLFWLLIMLQMAVTLYLRQPNRGLPMWLTMAPMYIWILIFFTRPHKVGFMQS